MRKGKYRALDNIYSFSSICGEDVFFIPEKDIKDYIEVRKGEIIDYRGGCGRIIRNNFPVDIAFEDIYKVSPNSFEFLGDKVRDIVARRIKGITPDQEVDSLRKEYPEVKVDKLYEDFYDTPPSMRKEVFGTDNFTYLVTLIGRAEPIQIAKDFGTPIAKLYNKYRR